MGPWAAVVLAPVLAAGGLHCSDSNPADELVLPGAGDASDGASNGRGTGMDGGGGPVRGGDAGDATSPVVVDSGAPGSDGGSDMPDTGGGNPNPGDDAGMTADDAGDAGGPAPDAGGKMPCKRGIAANAAPSAAMAPTATNPGVTWWYNWASQGSGQGAGIEFVPMLWGKSQINDSLPGSYGYLLGFNEPNFKAQANLTPQQAADAWPMVEARAKAVGAPTVSPAVNFCGSSSDPSQCSDPSVTDPYTYLSDFFAACTGCEVDYVAVHWYNCDLPSLQAYIDGSPGGLAGFVQFGKPIWLTEFSCDGSASVADQKAYIQAAIPYLENNPHVYRYSWFSAGPIPNAVLMNDDGSLTDLGQTYVSLPASCR
jgi:hypothetical protein